MFSALAEKFQSIFVNFLKEKTIKEEHIQDALTEVRLALLDADVQYGVVKNFVKKVKEKAIGQEVLQAVSPHQQFIKIVHDELVLLLGEKEEEISFSERPTRILMCGLQGSGKTTHSVKLALYLKNKKGFSKPCVVACDLERPAAVHQLKTLADSANIDCFLVDGEKNPVRVAESAFKMAKEKMWDLLIFDTAGRLHLDQPLMDELLSVKKATSPHHVILTMNAATGQDAVTSAEAFSSQIGVTGTCLTMLDGLAKGGAAISLREITKQPILFEGHGEKIHDIRPFHPVSMADRILGMGDTINLVRKAEEVIKEEDAKELGSKLKNAELTFQDFLKQMQTMKKMGSMKSLLGMLPGMGSLKDLQVDDRHIVKVEAMILSMTRKERICHDELSMSRRKRIAAGSGTTVDDVNHLVKTFKQAKQFFKGNSMKQMEKKMKGGNLWH